MAAVAAWLSDTRLENNYDETAKILSVLSERRPADPVFAVPLSGSYRKIGSCCPLMVNSRGCSGYRSRALKAIRRVDGRAGDNG